MLAYCVLAQPQLQAAVVSRQPGIADGKPVICREHIEVHRLRAELVDIRRNLAHERAFLRWSTQRRAYARLADGHTCHVDHDELPRGAGLGG
jgi:hypothetical protein